MFGGKLLRTITPIFFIFSYILVDHFKNASGEEEVGPVCLTAITGWHI